MKDVRFNIKNFNSPFDQYQHELLNKKTHNEFFQRFSTYISSSGKYIITPEDLQKISALELFKNLIEKTFILSIEKDGFYQTKGFIDVSNGFLVFVDIETQKEFPILINDQKVEIKNLRKPILEKINGNINSNIPNLFFELLEKHLVKIVTGSIFSRYSVYTKKTMLKRLTGIKWALKNDIRWAIKEVVNNIGVIEKEFTLDNKSKMMGLAPKKKLIHTSVDGDSVALQPWDSFPEEGDIFIQGGSSGVVFSESGNYSTAFVEVFPKFLKDGNTFFSSFIRGEGLTIQEAESKAFNFLKKAKECKRHEWETRGRMDGCGFCIHCRVFNSKAFPELKK